MIHEPPLLRIKRNFDRPDGSAVAAIGKTNSSWIGDALDGRAALDAGIKSVGAGNLPVCGPAITCYLGVNTNLALFAAIAMAEPGDVVVAATDGFTGAAIIGDILAGMAKNSGVAAVVTDGMARDLPGLREVGLPIMARGITPNSAVREGPGTVGLPVQIGGRQVASGDLVFADEDGVVTVPAADLPMVEKRIEEIAAAEEALVARVRDGLDRPDHIKALLASDRTIYID